MRPDGTNHKKTATLIPSILGLFTVFLGAALCFGVWSGFSQPRGDPTGLVFVMLGELFGATAGFSGLFWKNLFCFVTLHSFLSLHASLSFPLGIISLLSFLQTIMNASMFGSLFISLPLTLILPNIIGRRRGNAADFSREETGFLGVKQKIGLILLIISLSIGSLFYIPGQLFLLAGWWGNLSYFISTHEIRVFTILDRIPKIYEAMHSTPTIHVSFMIRFIMDLLLPILGLLTLISIFKAKRNLLKLSSILLLLPIAGSLLSFYMYYGLTYGLLEPFFHYWYRLEPSYFYINFGAILLVISAIILFISTRKPSFIMSEKMAGLALPRVSEKEALEVKRRTIPIDVDAKRVIKICAIYLIPLFLLNFLLMPDGILSTLIYNLIADKPVADSLVAILSLYPNTLILLLLTSKLSTTLTEHKVGKCASIIFDGAAIACLLSFFFSLLAIPVYWMRFHRPDAFIYLGAAGITLYRERVFFTKEWLKRIFNAIGFAMVVYALWKMTAPFFSVIDDIRLAPYFIVRPLNLQTAFFMGLFAMVLASFISCGALAKNKVVSEICRWVHSSQFRNFIIGFFLGTYLLIVRPFIMALLPYAMLIEWGIAGFIVARAYAGFKSEISGKYTVPLRVAYWRKHTQEIKYMKEKEFEDARRFQEIFVEEGRRGPLIIYLTSLLLKNGLSVDQIDLLMRPLIEYEDEKVPLLAFSWEKRRVINRNRKSREEVLNQVMKNIFSIIEEGEI